MKNIYIKSISHYIPAKKVTNDELISAYSLKIKASWISQRLGISARAWAEDSETTSDLAVKSLQKLQNSTEAPLFLSTISPDYLTPSTSAEIKRKMNWDQGEIAIDIANACAGHIFAIDLASRYLQTSEKNIAYACAAETRSRFLNKQDRRTVFIFADAASSLKLTTDEKDTIAKINWIKTFTKFSPEHEILIPAGGAKTPLTPEGLSTHQNTITMCNGPQIEDTIFETLLKLVQDNLTNNQETLEHYDWMFFHQGNTQLIHKVCEKLNFPTTKTHTTFEKFGNSSSASLIVTLSDAYEQGLLKKGQKILLVAMGAGYHAGISSLSWNM